MSSPNELSFLPDDYHERKMRRRANILCGTLSAVVLAAVGGAFAVTERSMRDCERRHTQVVKEYTEAARRIEQVKKMHEQQRRIVQHAELAASLVEKVPRSNVLAELTNTLPAGVSLLDFALESKLRTDPVPVGNAFEQKKAALEAKHKEESQPVQTPRFDVHCRLSGVADNDVQVAQYLTRLNQSSIFREVNLVISDVYHPAGEKGEVLRRFQIEMMINPDAEVRDNTRAIRTAAVELSK